MKRIILLAFPLFLAINLLNGQIIDPAPHNKAVVYFTRISSNGFAINFSYFDSTKLIGVFNGPKYIRYECDPGIHLFWARSENFDFLEAEVEAGKIYFIEALVKMGAVKAAVGLQPIDPGDSKKMEKVFKLMNKRSSESFTIEKLKSETVRLDGVVLKGMEKYEAEKAKGKINAQLKKEMYYNPN